MSTNEVLARENLYCFLTTQNEDKMTVTLHQKMENMTKGNLNWLLVIIPLAAPLHGFVVHL
jgi:hypothetical protein